MKIARTLASTILTLLGVSIVVFCLLRLVPGDPIAMMLPPGATDDVRANLERLYGLDRSIPEQYVIWLGKVLQLDFGISTQFRLPVMEVIFNHLPATLELVLLASIMAGILAFSLAIISVWVEADWMSYLVEFLSGITQAIPDFLWALIFILAVTLYFPYVPITGRFDPRFAQTFHTDFYLFEALLTLQWSAFSELMRYAFLPSLALSLPLSAALVRILKGSLEEAMAQDYVLMARAKNKGRFSIVIGEALRNALIPTIALASVQLTFLIGGTVLIERQFSFPGLGNTAISSITNRDLPLIQGIVLVYATLFILINLISNGLYRLVDPRLRSNR